MAAKQGFLMYYSKGDAIGTKVSVRYRRSGRLSGVVVKRDSTVYIYIYTSVTLLRMRRIINIIITCICVEWVAMVFLVYREGMQLPLGCNRSARGICADAYI